MIFEWNIEKSEKNLKKHGVSFNEAEIAFEDLYAIEKFNEKNSTADESRFKMLAITGEKIIVAAYTMRGENFRIISARKAEKYERELYERQRSEDFAE